ncbi:helix-turn-helix domain-containing protein [Synergistaceae bacterium OttesenSCG-928-D05]|nr:helix-turn-helix domain-containing protein [Synergistaceae bacterium OttesenSCG-928-D05]
MSRLFLFALTCPHAQNPGTGLEGLEEILPDDNTRRRIREMEVIDMLRHAVSDGELEVADAFLKGYTQTEIAKLLGISQQAVAKRLANIRKKTRPLLLRG